MNDYTCGVCGRKGVKLWLKPKLILAGELHCTECASIITGPHDGFPDTDRLGSFIPAIPSDPDGKTFWAFGHVPDKDYAWWCALPPSREEWLNR